MEILDTLPFQGPPWEWWKVNAQQTKLALGHAYKTVANLTNAAILCEQSQLVGDAFHLRDIEKELSQQLRIVGNVPQADLQSDEAARAYTNLWCAFLYKIEAAGVAASSLLHSTAIVCPHPTADSLTGEGDAGDVSLPNTHSDDFRSVRWRGTTYYFTGNQAAAVKVLWTTFHRGTPDVGSETLLNAADAHTQRVNVLFRGNAAWKSMIVKGKTKGTYRLSSDVDLSLPAETGR